MQIFRFDSVCRDNAGRARTTRIIELFENSSDIVFKLPHFFFHVLSAGVDVRLSHYARNRALTSRREAVRAKNGLERLHI